MLKFLLQVICLVNSLAASEGVSKASDYQDNSSLQWKWALESLEVFAFDKNDRVLDLGCGTGSVTSEIAARVPLGVVIGLDISEAMLAYAREHYHGANIIYMQGDARELPFVEQFDKVTALLSLNWIHEQEQALNALYRAMKVNGKALITRPGKQPSNLGPVVQELIKRDQWAPYFVNFEQEKRYYTAEEYRILLENAGFFVEEMSEHSTYTHFENKLALIGFFRPLCHSIDHLPLALQRQFVEEIVDKVLETNQILPDGSILLHDFKLETMVRKNACH